MGQIARRGSVAPEAFVASWRRWPNLGTQCLSRHHQDCGQGEDDVIANRDNLETLSFRERSIPFEPTPSVSVLPSLDGQGGADSHYP